MGADGSGRSRGGACLTGRWPGRSRGRGTETSSATRAFGGWRRSPGAVQGKAWRHLRRARREGAQRWGVRHARLGERRADPAPPAGGERAAAKAEQAEEPTPATTVASGGPARPADGPAGPAGGRIATSAERTLAGPAESRAAASADGLRAAAGAACSACPDFRASSSSALRRGSGRLDCCCRGAARKNAARSIRICARVDQCPGLMTTIICSLYARAVLVSRLVSLVTTPP